MFFRKKGKLRKEMDEELLRQLEILKEDWMKQKILIEKSIDPAEDILNELKLAESKYFFLLREAKQRKLFLGKS
ncbi:YaaL family protein [Bacillus sp. PS06]|uniref:YaaL family protein n=1 Tax=Bacillus sp. PS06 TaxID=2764176 RepID=UPI001782088E|nr:YaaL family protein [Bacillus sp. PS06]MBD8071524.1 YaaL family protein [Bacillus sp. PS06]